MGGISRPNNLFELLSLLRQQDLPKTNWPQHIDRFLESKARRFLVPIQGIFELTPLCNLDCKMCYVHLNGDCFDSSRLLTVCTWKDMMSQAKESGMLWATLTGGECLTYPGFEELYVYLNELGLRTSIFTNGVLIDDHHISLFKIYRPRSIRITLYGATEDEYEAVTGHRVFHIVYNHIIRLRDAGQHVTLSITPNRFMTGDSHKLLNLCESLGVEYHINSGLLIPRDNTGRPRLDTNDQKYLELYTLSQRLKNVKLSPVDPTEMPDSGTKNPDPRRGLRCGGGSSGFVIQYDGKMAPCAGLYDLSTEPLKQGFLPAWRELNRLAREYPMPEECGGCAYRKSCLLCPAMHRGAPVGHCDENICRRTKLLVGAGLFPPPQKDNT